MWFGERLRRRQLTSRPDYLCPELWTKLGRNAQLKQRHKWSHEQPKLDNARRLRGSYFIDPEDKECKETIKNARKKLETPVAPAMRCKTSKNSRHVVTGGKSNEIKSKLACILEASESTRLHMGESLPNHHEDSIYCRKGRQFTALQYGTQIYSYAPSHEKSCSKGSSGERMGKIGKDSGVEPDERSKKEVINEARTKGAKVHFVSLMDICHLKNAELETKHQKYKGRIVLRV